MINEADDYLKHLNLLKNEFSNEIPKEVLHSTSQNKYFKVRKDWFQGVVADAANIIDEGYASQASMQMFENFKKHIKDTNMRNRLTIKEDIDVADRLLESLIYDLEEQKRQLQIS